MTDTPEFTDALLALPDRFTGPLTERDLPWLRDTTGAGEWGEALESLVAGLVHSRSTVSKSERDELRQLFKTAGLDVEAVDELTVAS